MAIIPLVSSLSSEKSGTSIKIYECGSRNNDTTPPVTTAILNPAEPNGDNGWYTSDVRITLNATDNESGVKVTYYFKAGQWQKYTGPFNLFEDCPSTWFFSVDNAGNVETPKNINLKIDQTDPIINLSYWLDFNKVIFIATCSDVKSGMARVEFYMQGVLQFVDTEPPYEWRPPVPPIDFLPVTGNAFDKAGNSALDSISTPNIQGQNQNSQPNSQKSNQQSSNSPSSQQINQLLHNLLYNLMLRH